MLPEQRKKDQGAQRGCESDKTCQHIPEIIVTIVGGQLRCLCKNKEHHQQNGHNE
ncbi:hypothetical protein [Raoultella terrigena]|uniref:hypothetical protein n=1 Tax=Raoultella terrigena TaxID=577 RepID=UPI001F2D5770|nr:hypothetical protein [Raoultella terrigena]MCE9897261.1 hypothetical protein [Raoultella terrigena]